jgi:hypothetical protein
MPIVHRKEGPATQDADIEAELLTEAGIEGADAARLESPEGTNEHRDEKLEEIEKERQALDILWKAAREVFDRLVQKNLELGAAGTSKDAADLDTVSIEDITREIKATKAQIDAVDKELRELQRPLNNVKYGQLQGKI